jgi:hypothetical protein
MFSLSELACGRENVVDPDGDSEMGTETRMSGMVGSSGDKGVGIGPREEVGEGGDVDGALVKAGVAISMISVNGSVWVETEV